MTNGGAFRQGEKGWRRPVARNLLRPGSRRYQSRRFCADTIRRHAHTKGYFNAQIGDIKNQENTVRKER